MIYIVTLGVGFKCPRKIHLNTEWGWGGGRSDHQVCAENVCNFLKYVFYF